MNKAYILSVKQNVMILSIDKCNFGPGRFSCLTWMQRKAKEEKKKTEDKNNDSQITEYTIFLWYDLLSTRCKLYLQTV